MFPKTKAVPDLIFQYPVYKVAPWEFYPLFETAEQLPQTSALNALSTSCYIILVSKKHRQNYRRLVLKTLNYLELYGRTYE
jgi:hypothetical protein